MGVCITRWARTIKIDHATQADEDRMKPELWHKMYLLGHSDLATTERYMGSFDTTKTDNSLRSLFKKKKVGTDGLTDEERVQQAVELLKGMPPEQIMGVISAINK